ncbi:unnamed protein product [Closterium sp. Naga37s-1]|nr:unnamed protein product [Closterium sp. Naga37s-1]
MARKRKSVASSVDLCPRDLDEIPYIAWMNKQIAAGRKPAGPLPEGAPGAGDTSFEAPRDVPTRGRRHADRVASSRVNDDAAFDDDDDAADSDYNECDEACEDDADSGEEQDKGMSPSEDEVDADEDADALTRLTAPIISHMLCRMTPQDAPARMRQSLQYPLDGAELCGHLVEVVAGREVDPLLLEDGREMHEERVNKHVAQGLGQPELGGQVYERHATCEVFDRSSSSNWYLRRRNPALRFRSAVRLEARELDDEDTSSLKTFASSKPPTDLAMASMNML